MFDVVFRRVAGWSSGGAITPVLFSFAHPPAGQLQPQHWDRQTAGQLLQYVQGIDRQGLLVADYAPDALQHALQSDDAGLLQAAAARSSELVARDLMRGKIPPGCRGRNFIASDTIQPAALAELIDLTLDRRNVRTVLDGLAPQDKQYADLKAALAGLPTGDSTERRALRVTLERLRWLPRNIEADRLVVNIPEYLLRLVVDGEEVSSIRQR